MNTPRFCWTSAALSDVGLVRRTNEDACLDAPERGLWAVADGMGGHACGDIASAMIVEALSKLTPPATLPAFVLAIRDYLRLVNTVLQAAAARRNVSIIGSTVAVLAAIDGDCAVLWAGDSRAYLLRQGVLRQLTRDHSQVAEQVINQRVSGSQGMPAAEHGASNIVTRAVGAADTLLMDEASLAVVDGDVLLLCSDGLTKAVSDPEIARAVVPGNCRHSAQALVALALQHGGEDNISVVVLSVEDLCSADRTIVNPAF